MDTPDTLAVALLKAAATVPVLAAAVVQTGIKNVEHDGRRNSIQSSGRSASGAPYAITSDRPSRHGFAIGAEAGYEARGQGYLGHLLEYGGTIGAVHSAPHRDMNRALDAEEPRFLRFMQQVGLDAINKRR